MRLSCGPGGCTVGGACCVAGAAHLAQKGQQGPLRGMARWAPASGPSQVTRGWRLPWSETEGEPRALSLQSPFLILKPRELRSNCWGCFLTENGGSSGTL